MHISCVLRIPRSGAGEEATLVDPMCGSATLLLEAAQMAHNRLAATALTACLNYGEHVYGNTTVLTCTHSAPLKKRVIFTLSKEGEVLVTFGRQLSIVFFIL